jgi:hypothetical protein
VVDPNEWNNALARKLALVDPGLHDRFRDLQPFVTNPAMPDQEPLAMLDGLWNIDKHRVVHLANVDIALEVLKVWRRADGRALDFGFRSWGPRRLDLDRFDEKTQLARLEMREPWPDTPEKVKHERGLRVNLALDLGAPGFGKNMQFVHVQIHNAVVRTARAFEPEFT